MDGLSPNVTERLNIDFDSLHSHMVVAYGVHNPPETDPLKTAKAKEGERGINVIKIDDNNLNFTVVDENNHLELPELESLNIFENH